MSSQLILDSNRYFHNLVDDAFKERKFETYPHVKLYVVDVLKYYVITENLFDEEDLSGRKTRKTMAELFLSAGQMGGQERFKNLKKVGDSSLYISGFFSDSFQRKIIDVDYYMDMGRMAFETLSKDVGEDLFSKLYKDLSSQFMELVDVLSLISQRAQMTDAENLLRMMDVYAKTGSPLRGETLAEKGVFTQQSKKQKPQ